MRQPTRGSVALSPTPEFRCVSPEVWRLDAIIPKARRRRLLSPPPFENIVASLCEKVTVEAVRYEQVKSGENAYRVFAKLRTSGRAIDLFHNSAGGYRAQYLVGVEVGEAANRLVLDELLPHVVPLMLRYSKNSVPAIILKQSLQHPWAKLWIHQGLWLRHARREHRVLRVPLWEAQLSSEHKRCRKLARWGCLIPEFESAFVIKGGFIYPSGEHWFGAPTKDRAAELHTCGFT